MQEPHSEGVANHADLESCGGGSDAAAEALTEALAGGLLSREKTRFGGRPSGLKGKAIPAVAQSRVAVGSGAVARNLARQETPCARTGRPRQRSVACGRPVGEGVSRTPHAHVVEESDAGHSTCEGSEQGRATVGGGPGGKGPDRGERWRAPHSPHSEADCCETRGRRRGAGRCFGSSRPPSSEVGAV